MDLLNAKKRQIGGAKYSSHKAAGGIVNDIDLSSNSLIPMQPILSTGIPSSNNNTLLRHPMKSMVPTPYEWVPMGPGAEMREYPSSAKGVNFGDVREYRKKGSNDTIIDNPTWSELGDKQQFKYKMQSPKGKNGIKNASGGASTALMDPYSAADDQPRKVFAAGGVKHQAMDDPEFNSVLESLSKKSGINKDWVNRLIHIESGGDSSAHNPHGSASGIVQMIDSTAKAMGTSAEELRHMTASEQLPFAFKYWNQYKDKIKQPSDLYIANMYPAALGKSDDYAIGTDQQSRAKLAKLNPAIDVDKDQQITVGEIRRWFDPSYKSKMTPPGLPQNLTPSLADMTSYQKSNRELEIPGKTTLFPVQRTTLPSLNKPLPKTPTTGTRSAGEGIEQDTPNMDDWMQLYNKPDLAGDVNFVSNLFKM